jgi:Periplasmic binding protein
MKHLLSLSVLALALASGAAQAQVTDGVVKIGVMTDMAGLYSDISGPGSVVAARMAAEDSGVAAKGIKVEVLGADHQNKPDVGSNIVRRWIDVDNVDVIVDVPTSSIGLAVSEIVKAPGFSSPPTTRSDMRSSATPRRWSKPMAARCSARCAIPSPALTSPLSCCRRRLRRRR